MAVTSCIATMNDNAIEIMATSGNGDVKNHINNQTPNKVILALSGELFSRRFHIKPFETRGKLGHILPSLLQDSLFEEGSESYKTIFTTTSLEPNKFTSFTIKLDTLNQAIESASKQVSPIIAIAPLPFGLKYFAPSNEDAIIVAPTAKNSITALAIRASGEVAEFRTLSTKKWEKEGYLTLNTWLEFMPKAKIYSTYTPAKFPAIKNMPATLKKHLAKIEIPNYIEPKNMAMYGLLQISNTQWQTEEQIRVTDPQTWQNTNNLFKKLMLPLAGLGLATLIAIAGISYQSNNLTKQQTSIETATSTIFDAALPSTPMVDAPLQLTRRVNELALLNGSGLVNNNPLSDTILSINNAIKSADLSMSVDEFNINKNNLHIRGTLPSLSDIDTLQATISQIMVGYKTELNNANIGSNGQVSFQIESSKK